jgi:hypothetical protein
MSLRCKYCLETVKRLRPPHSLIHRQDLEFTYITASLGRIKHIVPHAFYTIAFNPALDSPSDGCASLTMVLLPQDVYEDDTECRIDDV